MVLVQKEIKRVTIRPNGTEKQIRPAGWTPSANTVAYFPFETDSTDHSNNHISVTTSGSVSYTTLASGKKVANFAGYTAYTNNSFINTYISSHKYTVNYWYTVNKNSNNRRNQFMICQNLYIIESGATTKETNASGYTRLYTCNGSSTTETGSRAYSGWINACVTVENGTATMYINGSSYVSHSTTSVSGLLGIGWSTNSGDYHNGYMSEFIVENKVRTAQEIADYYNLTKGNYGL